MKMAKDAKYNAISWMEHAASKTLIVRGLADDTTADAFEGCLAARVATDQETGKSKRFGFVDYEMEEMCVAAQEAMADGVVNGCRVGLGYARFRAKRGARPDSG